MQIEEAKEYLKKRNENYKSHKEEIDSVCSDIYGTNNVREYHKKQEAIEAVLNHIEKIEAESNNTVTRKKYRQTKKTLKGQIRKLNAVIDDMAEYIDNITFVDEKGDYGCDFELLTKTSCKYNGNCKDCIKEYFYKEARDNK